MRLYFSIVLFIILHATSMADDGRAGIDLPAIETFITEPTVIENVSFWVPAARSGPFDCSCKIQKSLASSLVLPASVKHQKTNNCPDQTARILAELTSFYHSQSLPLVIFNGWQWEYTYSLSQYELVNYDLARRGGWWENGWEAILNLSCGEIKLQQLNVESPEKFSIQKAATPESIIEVKTFSSMRTRDGYPKGRQL